MHEMTRPPDALRGALPERDGIAASSDEAVARADTPGSLQKPVEGQASRVASAAASCSAGTRCYAQRGECARFSIQLTCALLGSVVRTRGKRHDILVQQREDLPPRLLANKEQDWKEAARFLDVAANAYDDAINVAPDFPDPDSGEGPPLAKTRPHDMDSFHHVNLGLAHLRGGREASAAVEEMKRAE